MKTAGLTASDLDPDGKFFLLQQELQLAQWEAAEDTLNALDDKDMAESPALHHMMAMTHLLGVVPTESRPVLLTQFPFEAARLPLASNAAAIATRWTAHHHFVSAADAARQLDCPRAASLDDEYALWLELKDPENSHAGRQRLEDKLDDPKSALRLVPFGLQFGIKLNLVLVEQAIEQQIALHGEITQDAAIARFALAYAQETPADVAYYVARHYDQLSRHVSTRAMRFLQIEMFARAGKPQSATECLQLLLEEGISEAEEKRLRIVIAAAEGTDPIEALEAQFTETDSLGDLTALVAELEFRGRWESVCEYGEMLFGRTCSARDAERLAIALSKTMKYEQLVEFLEANSTLLAQSKNLQMLYCWSLFYEGKLLEVRSELSKLSGDQDDPNYRALQVNLGIFLGDWNSLSAFVANECAEKGNRSARDLIRTAQLALQLNSPNAKELLFAAADGGSDDAGILASAYILASTAGWEDDKEVTTWLHAAAELSGDDGPIREASLRDVLDQVPEWDRRESDISQQLSRGEIPMFMAADVLNKSLLDLMLLPALANFSQTDPRRRVAIPAYSGARHPSVLETGGAVGIDATALLTLSHLNLLEKAFDAFDTVYVPHSTLAWLFQEKQKTTYHQPSRIKDAHRLGYLLTTDVLQRLSPRLEPDSELSAQIGDELALFIAEAEGARDDEATQHIVVRSSPVHRLGSLMEEEANLEPHAAVLSSCQSIVDKLCQIGHLEAEGYAKASAYLQLHEKPWPHQPEIADGAILYLDDLALAYFLNLGMLEILNAAGFRLIVSHRSVLESNLLISYETLSDKVNDAIERIRLAINSRIESGKVTVARRQSARAPDEKLLFEHPTVGAIALAKECDAIIVDDRFVNQHARVNHGESQARVHSTLDLLDALVSYGSISPEERLEHRTFLRRSGYIFVSIDDELEGHLNSSEVMNDKVIEIAELKAIRENMLHVRMTTWLQLPEESFWLDTALKVLIRALRNLWKADVDLSCVRARSDWILDLVDVRGWAHRFGSENGDNIVHTGRGVLILMMLAPLPEIPQDVQDEYWSWIEVRMLAPIREQSPDLFALILDWHRRKIAKIVDTDLDEGEAT
ncbi:HNH endonuclease [Candidatus Bipolaricaulota bacterium]|nr:HNH endonuclease [Candidatus Bipolaricaulota bacterium]